VDDSSVFEPLEMPNSSTRLDDGGRVTPLKRPSEAADPGASDKGGTEVNLMELLRRSVDRARESKRAGSVRDDVSQSRRPTAGSTEETASVVDLMDALRRSVEEARQRKRKASALDEALVALRRVIPEGPSDPADWMEAGRLLRHAAIERKFSAPRTASVALVLSDALSFTEPGSITHERREPLRQGFSLLMKPFISTDEERELFRGLLRGKWYVTPGFDPAGFAGIDTQAE
jgi:hypothetical protein